MCASSSICNAVIVKRGSSGLLFDRKRSRKNSWGRKSIIKKHWVLLSLRRPYHILNYSVPLGKAWLNVAEVHLKCQHKLSVDNSHITFWPIPTPNFWEFARDPAIPKLKRSGELGQVVSLESQYNNCWRFPLTTHLLLSFYCGNELFSADNNYN